MSKDVSYIDIFCEGEYTETVEKYVLDLVLQVTATKEDTALDKVMQFRERCIKHLLDSGIQQSELFNGGTKLARAWYRRSRKKNFEKEASAKIIIQIGDIERLSQALLSIEKIKNNQYESVQITMREPVFGADEALVLQASQAAIRQAKEKAAVLAAEAGLELAGICRTKELSRVKRDSGAYGSEDWWGDSGRFTPVLNDPSAYDTDAYEEEDETDEGSRDTYKADFISLDLKSSRRTVWIRYKVRFAIKTD